MNERLKLLRQWMTTQPTAPDAYIIPTADPHNSEYVAPHWACREWITGFTGSAGLAIVTQKEAVLWTDSRYWLQAEEQLKDSEFQLMREGAEGVASPEDWVLKHVGCDAKIGAPAELINDAVLQIAYAIDEELMFRPDDAVIVTRADAFDTIWTDRPALPAAPIVPQDARYTGCDVKTKLERLEKELTHSNSCEDDMFVFNDLSDIAWLLNLRGADIAYNPVFLGYLVYDRCLHHFSLFTHDDTMTPEAIAQLREADVTISPYADVVSLLRMPQMRFSNGPFGLTSINYRTFENPVPRWRAQKDEAEMEGFRQAMLNDGVAMVRFLRWLDEQMQAGATVTEMDIDRQLTAFRAEQPGFEQPSFATIAAYGAHGAIVHYEADEKSNATLQPHGLLLLDSGGQYASGTTDITRTIALGPLTDEERHVNTLVMKGHLRLASLHFPVGTKGLQLDLAARIDMWAAGYDFGHGTGHGVGAHLCVHEGPQQIRKDERSATLIGFRSGMTITDEPGIYVTGKFGVRIENTLLCVPDRTTDYGSFLRFEVLTLCPYDLRALDLSLLSPREIEQINTYHRHVREMLLPHLTSEADQRWLAYATAAIEEEN